MCVFVGKCSDTNLIIFLKGNLKTRRVDCRPIHDPTLMSGTNREALDGTRQSRSCTKQDRPSFACRRARVVRKNLLGDNFSRVVHCWTKGWVGTGVEDSLMGRGEGQSLVHFLENKESTRIIIHRDGISIARSISIENLDRAMPICA